MRHPSAIGVHLGGRSIAAAQIAPTRSGPRLNAALVIERAQLGPEIAPEEIQRLVRVLDRRGFVGRSVTLALPCHAMLTGYLDLPPRSSGAPIEQIARAEMARTHRVEPGSIEVALWDLPAVGRAGQGAPTMAVACTHEAGESLAAVFHEGGLEVVAIDASPCALARACAPALAGIEGLGAIIEIGWASSRLVVVDTQRVVFERVLAGAGQQSVREALIEHLDLDEDIADYLLDRVGLVERQSDDRASWELLGEARALIREWLEGLTREADASLEYALRRYGHASAGRIVLAGPNAQMPGLAGELSVQLRAPVVTPGPSELVACRDGLDAGDGRLVCALGLALRMDR